MSRRLGHSKASITLDIYGHLIEGADAVAVGAIEDSAEVTRTDHKKKSVDEFVKLLGKCIAQARLDREGVYREPATGPGQPAKKSTRAYVMATLMNLE